MATRMIPVTWAVGLQQSWLNFARPSDHLRPANHGLATRRPKQGRAMWKARLHLLACPACQHESHDTCTGTVKMHGCLVLSQMTCVMQAGKATFCTQRGAVRPANLRGSTCRGLRPTSRHTPYMDSVHVRVPRAKGRIMTPKRWGPEIDSRESRSERTSRATSRNVSPIHKCRNLGVRTVMTIRIRRHTKTVARTATEHGHVIAGMAG